MIRTVLAVALTLAPFGATAAPVPASTPKQLTPEMVCGTWKYEWHSAVNGIACFNKDGTYVAMHDPQGTAAYCGTWRIENGDTIVIEEAGFDTATGRTWPGSTYRFAFDVRGYPTLKGTSNGSGHVKLSNPTR
jgi:hypothetical protein